MNPLFVAWVKSIGMQILKPFLKNWTYPISEQIGRFWTKPSTYSLRQYLWRTYPLFLSITRRTLYSSSSSDFLSLLLHHIVFIYNPKCLEKKRSKVDLNGLIVGKYLQWANCSTRSPRERSLRKIEENPQPNPRGLWFSLQESCSVQEGWLAVN